METRTLKKLRIELLSDLCTSVGETYNSLVDMPGMASERKNCTICLSESASAKDTGRYR